MLPHGSVGNFIRENDPEFSLVDDALVLIEKERKTYWLKKAARP